MNSIELLKALMKFESSTDQNANSAIEFVANYLKAKGISGQLILNQGALSLVATIGEGEKTLVLNGHLDVVSGKSNQFKPIIKKGRVIGRGSADMKSGCVAMIQAVIKLKDQPLNNKVMLQLVSDEETGGMKGSHYLVNQGYIGDFVICTEPTNLDISLQSKGIILMAIETTGKACHGSRPWEGDNAILKAFENYQAIKSMPMLNSGSDFYESSTVNLAKLRGGDIYNRVPDKSYMGLDIRYIPQLDPYEIIDAIKKVVEGEVIVKLVEPGVHVEASNPYVQKLFEVANQHISLKKSNFSAQHGGSDARFFAEKGIPAVEFGPIGNHWHGDEEYVDIESIYVLEKILIDYARNFSKC